MYWRLLIMGDIFDRLEMVRGQTVEEVYTGTKTRQKRRSDWQNDETFVLQVPFDLMARAAKLTRTAGMVYVLLHHCSRLFKRGRVSVPSSMLESCGISPQSYHTALDAMEQDGLVEVIRGGKGVSVEIELLPAGKVLGPGRLANAGASG
jgi:DNA-binding MarR family transcriptional regulator